MEPLVAQTVKSQPAVQETWVRSLCPEGPLEKEMATHSSILAWRIPWSWDRKESEAYLPGASVRNSAHGKGHEEGGLAYAKP